MSDMIKRVAISFKEIIKNSDWMDAKTKELAIEKIVAMRTSVGYPDFLLNDTALDAYYKTVLLSPEIIYYSFMFNINYYSWIIKTRIRFWKFKNKLPSRLSEKCSMIY